jgi:hypothetical protein
VGLEESTDIVPQPGLTLLQNPIRGDYIELLLYTSTIEKPMLILYNSLGQRVRTFSLNRLSSGEHKLRLRIKDLPSGVYFLKFTESLVEISGIRRKIRDFRAIKKLLLLQ